MWRTFRLQTLTGSAQPLFGDTLTAAFQMTGSGDQYGNQNGIMTVADTTLYQVGDRVTIDPNLTNQDTVLIEQLISATKMLVNSQGAKLHAHASSAIVQLNIEVAEIKITATPGNANPIYLGSDNTVTSAGGGNVVDLVVAGYPYRMTGVAQWNTVRTSDLWMAGTNPQTVIVAAQRI